jgi:hypothetical protein
MNAANAAMFLFASCNAMRILAYFYQMKRLLRHRQHAASICRPTWVLFAASNLSTVLYAGVVTSDWLMAAVFTLNAACCMAIISLGRKNHHSEGALNVDPIARCQEPIFRPGYAPAPKATH